MQYVIIIFHNHQFDISAVGPFISRNLCISHLKDSGFKIDEDWGNNTWRKCTEHPYHKVSHATIRELHQS